MKKILVVDDDKDLLASMKSFFKRQGYNVAVTTSCNEGLQILQSFQPANSFIKKPFALAGLINALDDYL